MSQIRYHVVKPGEQLPTIAQCYYGKGTSKAALLIWQHNRDQITDPNQVYPGQMLVIPHVRNTHAL